MVHQDASGSGPQVKQVEFNTIAASFGGLSAQTTQLHKYVEVFFHPLITLAPLLPSFVAT